MKTGWRLQSIFVDQKAKINCNYAKQFASWNCGSSENINVMMSQYIPKKHAMSTFSNEKIRTIQKR
jgi:IS30 family transposase